MGHSHFQNPFLGSANDYKVVCGVCGKNFRTMFDLKAHKFNNHSY